LTPDFPVPEADAAFARQRGKVCAVMTADCLPVLFCDRAATTVAAAHAGWRGLHAGVLEKTVAAMPCAPDQLLAWLGPAIGPAAFEVGDEVRQAFVQDDALAAAAFVPHQPGKWFCDLYQLARMRLRRAGVASIYGGDLCTFSDPQRFFSYRRDAVTGRMASLIWLA
jgi:YfiH family protein